MIILPSFRGLFPPPLLVHASVLSEMDRRFSLGLCDLPKHSEKVRARLRTLSSTDVISLAGAVNTRAPLQVINSVLSRCRMEMMPSPGRPGAYWLDLKDEGDRFERATLTLQMGSGFTYPRAFSLQAMAGGKGSGERPPQEATSTWFENLNPANHLAVLEAEGVGKVAVVRDGSGRYGIIAAGSKPAPALLQLNTSSRPHAELLHDVLEALYRKDHPDKSLGAYGHTPLQNENLKRLLETEGMELLPENVEEISEHGFVVGETSWCLFGSVDVGAQQAAPLQETPAAQPSPSPFTEAWFKIHTANLFNEGVVEIDGTRFVILEPEQAKLKGAGLILLKEKPGGGLLYALINKPDGPSAVTMIQKIMRALDGDKRVEKVTDLIKEMPDKSSFIGMYDVTGGATLPEILLAYTIYFYGFTSDGFKSETGDDVWVEGNQIKIRSKNPKLPVVGFSVSKKTGDPALRPKVLEETAAASLAEAATLAHQTTLAPSVPLSQLLTPEAIEKYEGPGHFELGGYSYIFFKSLTKEAIMIFFRKDNELFWIFLKRQYAESRLAGHLFTQLFDEISQISNRSTQTITTWSHDRDVLEQERFQVHQGKIGLRFVNKRERKVLSVGMFPFSPTLNKQLFGKDDKCVLELWKNWIVTTYQDGGREFFSLPIPIEEPVARAKPAAEKIRPIAASQPIKDFSPQVTETTSRVDAPKPGNRDTLALSLINRHTDLTNWTQAAEAPVPVSIRLRNLVRPSLDAALRDRRGDLSKIKLDIRWGSAQAPIIYALQSNADSRLIFAPDNPALASWGTITIEMPAVGMVLKLEQGSETQRWFEGIFEKPEQASWPPPPLERSATLDLDARIDPERPAQVGVGFIRHQAKDAKWGVREIRVRGEKVSGDPLSITRKTTQPLGEEQFELEIKPDGDSVTASIALYRWQSQIRETAVPLEQDLNGNRELKAQYVRVISGMGAPDRLVLKDLIIRDASFAKGAVALVKTPEIGPVIAIENDPVILSVRIPVVLPEPGFEETALELRRSGPDLAVRVVESRFLKNSELTRTLSLGLDTTIDPEKGPANLEIALVNKGTREAPVWHVEGFKIRGEGLPAEDIHLIGFEDKPIGDRPLSFSLVRKAFRKPEATVSEEGWERMDITLRRDEKGIRAGYRQRWLSRAELTRKIENHPVRIIRQAQGESSRTDAFTIDLTVLVNPLGDHFIEGAQLKLNDEKKLKALGFDDAAIQKILEKGFSLVSKMKPPIELKRGIETTLTFDAGEKLGELFFTLLLPKSAGTEMGISRSPQGAVLSTLKPQTEPPELEMLADPSGGTATVTLTRLTVRGEVFYLITGSALETFAAWMELMGQKIHYDGDPASVVQVQVDAQGKPTGKFFMRQMVDGELLSEGVDLEDLLKAQARLRATHGAGPGERLDVANLPAVRPRPITLTDSETLAFKPGASFHPTARQVERIFAHSRRRKGADGVERQVVSFPRNKELWYEEESDDSEWALRIPVFWTGGSRHPWRFDEKREILVYRKEDNPRTARPIDIRKAANFHAEHNRGFWRFYLLDVSQGTEQIKPFELQLVSLTETLTQTVRIPEERAKHYSPFVGLVNVVDPSEKVEEGPEADAHREVIRRNHAWRKTEARRKIRRAIAERTDERRFPRLNYSFFRLEVGRGKPIRLEFFDPDRPGGVGWAEIAGIKRDTIRGRPSLGYEKKVELVIGEGPYQKDKKDKRVAEKIRVIPLDHSQQTDVVRFVEMKNGHTRGTRVFEWDILGSRLSQLPQGNLEELAEGEIEARLAQVIFIPETEGLGGGGWGGNGYDPRAAVIVDERIPTLPDADHVDGELPSAVTEINDPAQVATLLERLDGKIFTPDEEGLHAQVETGRQREDFNFRTKSGERLTLSMEHNQDGRYLFVDDPNPVHGKAVRLLVPDREKPGTYLSLPGIAHQRRQSSETRLSFHIGPEQKVLTLIMGKNDKTSGRPAFGFIIDYAERKETSESKANYLVGLDLYELLDLAHLKAGSTGFQKGEPVSGEGKASPRLKLADGRVLHLRVTQESEDHPFEIVGITGGHEGHQLTYSYEEAGRSKEGTMRVYRARNGSPLYYLRDEQRNPQGPFLVMIISNQGEPLFASRRPEILHFFKKVQPKDLTLKTTEGFSYAKPRNSSLEITPASDPGSGVHAVTVRSKIGRRKGATLSGASFAGEETGKDQLTGKKLDFAKVRFKLTLDSENGVTVSDVHIKSEIEGEGWQSEHIETEVLTEPNGKIAVYLRGPLKAGHKGARGDNTRDYFYFEFPDAEVLRHPDTPAKIIGHYNRTQTSKADVTRKQANPRTQTSKADVTRKQANAYQKFPSDPDFLEMYFRGYRYDPVFAGIFHTELVGASARPETHPVWKLHDTFKLNEVESWNALKPLREALKYFGTEQGDVSDRGWQTALASMYVAARRLREKDPPEGLRKVELPELPPHLFEPEREVRLDLLPEPVEPAPEEAPLVTFQPRTVDEAEVGRIRSRLLTDHRDLQSGAYLKLVTYLTGRAIYALAALAEKEPRRRLTDLVKFLLSADLLPIVIQRLLEALDDLWITHWGGERQKAIIHSRLLAKLDELILRGREESEDLAGMERLQRTKRQLALGLIHEVVRLSTLLCSPHIKLTSVGYTVMKRTGLTVEGWHPAQGGEYRLIRREVDYSEPRKRPEFDGWDERRKIGIEIKSLQSDKTRRPRGRTAGGTGDAEKDPMGDLMPFEKFEAFLVQFANGWFERENPEGRIRKEHWDACLRAAQFYNQLVKYRRLMELGLIEQIQYHITFAEGYSDAVAAAIFKVFDKPAEAYLVAYSDLLTPFEFKRVKVLGLFPSGEGGRAAVRELTREEFEKSF